MSKYKMKLFDVEVQNVPLFIFRCPSILALKDH
jgi:hypothetical protein